MRNARNDVYGRTAVGEFLNPINGYRGRLAQRGIKPKNHARENLLALRVKQKENQMAVQEEPVHSNWKMKEFRHVQSRIDMEAPRARRGGGGGGGGGGGSNNNSNNPRKALADSDSDASSLQQSPSKPFLKKGSRAARDEARALKANASNSPRLTPRKSLENGTGKAPVPKASEVAPPPARRRTDFVANNRSEAVAMKAKPPSPTSEVHRHSDFGSVPQYLVDRREQEAADERRRREQAPDPNCPPGMTLMSEEERLETLEILKQSEREANELLHKLPLHATTQRVAVRKDALEAKLKEIDAAKRLFSKPKVYVKA